MIQMRPAQAGRGWTGVGKSPARSGVGPPPARCRTASASDRGGMAQIRGEAVPAGRRRGTARRRCGPAAAGVPEEGSWRVERLGRATLGGGCFWCLEPVFAELEGVVEVLPGYAGGHVANPTYEQVCTGTTGHAEVVRVTFDPAVIPYREILEVFFSAHDPTTVDRQGADVGPQYRSVIFYHDEEQRRAAEALIRELDGSGAFGAPIVTRVEPFRGFYPAEEYHRRYYYRNPGAPYCRLVIRPKLERVRRRFAGRLKGLER